MVNGGTITVTAGGDGLKSDNEEDATMGYVSIAGGTIGLTAGGDGIDAVTDVVVTDGLSVNSEAAAPPPPPTPSAKGIKGAVQRRHRGRSDHRSTRPTTPCIPTVR